MADGGVGVGIGVERRVELAKEIKVNDLVIYVHRGVARNALVTKNFDSDKRTPRLSFIYVKRGELGLATREFIPHRFHQTPKDEKDEVGYWIFPLENVLL